jgi:hypothetical protein
MAIEMYNLDWPLTVSILREYAIDILIKKGVDLSTSPLGEN